MKKKIFSFILLITITGSVLSQENSPETFVKKIAVENFTRLIIRSNITVMLIEVPSEDSVRIEGSKKFIEKVMIIQAGKELTVRSKKERDHLYTGSLTTKHGNKCGSKSYLVQFSAITGFKHSYKWRLCN